MFYVYSVMYYFDMHVKKLGLMHMKINNFPYAQKKCRRCDLCATQYLSSCKQFQVLCTIPIGYICFEDCSGHGNLSDV